MSRTRVVYILLVFAALSAAPGARAEVVTWAFGGVVDGVFDFDGALAGAVAPGDVLAGTVSYEVDTPDANALPDAGDYFSAVTTILGELNGNAYDGPVTGPLNRIAIRNSNSATSNDTVAFSAGVNLLDFLARLQFGFDVHPDLITTAQLLELPPITSNGLEGDFLFESEGDSPSFKIVGTLDFVVPEPATLVLLAISSGSLLACRRRKKAA